MQITALHGKGDARIQFSFRKGQETCGIIADACWIIEKDKKEASLIIKGL